MHAAIRRFDIFPKFDTKFEQDAREKTILGAILSVLALICIALLLLGEINYYCRIEKKHDLYVDTDITTRINIQCIITFPSVPCELVSVDAVDSFGEYQLDLEKRTTKTRLAKDGTALSESQTETESTSTDALAVKEDGGKECLSCYGAESHPGECCNTCDDVKKAYSRKGWSMKITDQNIVQCASERSHAQARVKANEGCRIDSSMKVKKVQGNLHFVPGRTIELMGQHMHDTSGFKGLNLSHEIELLQFGQKFPGLLNPLDGQVKRMEESDKMEESTGGRFQYFVKVVPTRYERLDGSYVETNQYSVTEHYASVPADNMHGLPGVFFIYDLSPIKVSIYETRPYSSLAHFVLQLCAITGGVFTVMGLIDAAMYHGVRNVKRKMQIGKFN